MIFPEAIQHFDEQFFILINSTWSNDVFDTILPPIREKQFWIPMYILIAGIMVYRLRLRGLYMVLLVIANFAASDQMSSAVIKPAVGRLRPCNEAAFQDSVILRIDACGAGKSFTSSHATNTFAFAVMLILLFRKRLKWITPAALLWAGSISYAQVYVGVHYPLDIIGGALLGTLISIILFNIAQRWFRLIPLEAGASSNPI